MKTSDFDFILPEELIAQTPVEPRDHSRLMIVDRKNNSITHDHFYNLLRYLQPDDLLVFNETKVFPARLFGHKKSGGKVEVLLLNLVTGEFISHPGLKNSQEVIFDQGLSAIVENNRLKFNVDNNHLKSIIDSIGHTPLPPYIDSSLYPESPNLRQRYQTVYAKNEGSVAAPTAGFHFTERLLSEIPNKAFLTLHVGLGTFRPVKSDNIEEHVMHAEAFEISSDTRSRILDARRVVAVGTTSARTLESDWHQSETSIFIYPGYEFKRVDALITNFHLPKSTLLMLVSALAGRELIMRAYAEAVKEKYRFYSFGDAMLIV